MKFEGMSGGSIWGTKIYENLMADFRQLGIKTLGGIFGEMMNVELVNEGPATFIINSKEL